MNAIGRFYATAAALCCGFALWGSWYPFAFVSVPADQALTILWSTVATPPAEWSLTDVVSNLALFVPIGVCLSAVRAQTRHLPLSPAAVVALGAGLSLVAELGQAFVPWRAPSAIDVLAETAGVLLGIALWKAIGSELDWLLTQLLDMAGRAPVLERVLLGYAAVLAVMWLVPFDFTIRPNEIADKYVHKRLLLPFQPSPDAATAAQLGVSFAAGVPLGIAAALCGCPAGGRRSVLVAFLLGAAGLSAVAFAQVFVFSRTTDSRMLIAALPGIAIGAVSARWTARPIRRRFSLRFAGGAAAVALMAAVVVAFEWWPLEFDADSGRASARLQEWSRSLFRMPALVRHVAPGAAAAVLAGGYLGARVYPQFLRLQTLGIIATGVAVAVTLEAGRLLLPDQPPTFVSVVVKAAALGAAVAAAQLRTQAAAVVRARS